MNKENFFFKLKKIFLWITLSMYLCDCADNHFNNSKRKKQSRNFFKSKKLFFDRIAKHKFIWYKEICFELKKIFSGCAFHSRNLKNWKQPPIEKSHVGNYLGNYVRNYMGNYMGSYMRSYAGNYIGNNMENCIVIWARILYSFPCSFRYGFLYSFPCGFQHSFQCLLFIWWLFSKL